ncbi:TPA: hypothetical protein I8149_001820 [Citrobacter freundii]|nr:hypothetical protein [Citrobacter freundii]HEM8625825.1 hypothetical protein [Citrobacter farmeri]HAT2484931.1 hypothetical protein [Citrobacter freundii]HAT2720008.1 hypothetical protein [Citrobacter freundii]HAT2730097.1 hypothetical protein [Citrobacter freundii]
MDTNSLFSAFGYISSTVQEIIKERDQIKLAALTCELQNKIIEAQGQFFEVTSKIGEQQKVIAELEKKIHSLEDLLNLRDSYELVLLSKEQGFYAYRYTRSDEAEHYICQTCFDSGNRKHVLRIREDEFCMCPNCGQDKGIWLNASKRPSVVSVRRRRDREMF